MNQKQAILRYMKTHRAGITTWSAMHDLNVARLSERIREIEADGHKIIRVPMTGKNAYGNNVRVIKYKLA